MKEDQSPSGESQDASQECPSAQELADRCRADEGRPSTPSTWDPPPDGDVGRSGDTPRAPGRRRYWWLASGLSVLVLGLRLALAFAPQHGTTSASSGGFGAPSAPDPDVSVTPRGVCQGSGLPRATDIRANSSMGLAPLKDVTVSDRSQGLSVVLDFDGAPPRDIAGSASRAFQVGLQSDGTSKPSSFTLFVIAGGIPGPNWTAVVLGSQRSVSMLGIPVTVAAGSLSATFPTSDLTGISTPFFWNVSEVLVPPQGPSSETVMSLCPWTLYSG